MKGNSATNFVGTIASFFQNLQNTRFGDALLGISSIIILLLLRVFANDDCNFFIILINQFNFQKLKDVKAPENASKRRRTFHSTLWLIATARNVLLVVTASAIAFYCERAGTAPFILTGTVRSGIPNWEIPPSHTTVLNTNGTIVEMNFGGMVGNP